MTMQGRESSLLTEGAVQATRGFELPAPHPQTWKEADRNICALVEAFLRYHATEGREALVDKLAAKSGYHGVALDKGTADRVVTALFGEAAG